MPPSLKSQRAPCRGGHGGSMSFWLPFSAPWSLGPGVRRENENNPPPRCPLSFPPRKRGPRNRDDAAVMERTSAQRTFRRHDVRAHFPFVEKSARSLLRSP